MNKKIIQQICLSFLLVLTLVCIPVTGVQAQTQKVSIKMENVRDVQKPKFEEVKQEIAQQEQQQQVQKLLGDLRAKASIK